MEDEHDVAPTSYDHITPVLQFDFTSSGLQGLCHHEKLDSYD